MTILFIGHDWHNSVFQRFQHLAANLARHCRVLYWGSSVSWNAELSDSLARGRASLGFRVWRPSPQLLVVTVPRLLPWRLRDRAAELQFLFARFGSRLLTGAALEGPFDAAILATYSPLDALVWQRARARVRVYDCYDENVHFHSAGSRAAAMVEQTEDRVTRQADLVLASTPQLQERLAARHRRVVLVPNAADAEHFSPKQDQPEPAELQGIAGPILGFVGVIQSWVDIDLIARVAQLLEGWTIVLVGPIERDVAALQALANVRLLGRKPYDALPAFVRRFDVGMIPFALNELTRAVDPVKFYEYCAAGKPVVSTPLPSMRGRSNVVYLAASAGEMATQVRRALAEDNRERRAFRLDIAARNSWASRAELILREIERAAGKSSEH